MKHYSPTGRRNHGRPLKRLLDTWDRNGSTSDPNPWQIYDDDDEFLFKMTPSSLKTHYTELNHPAMYKTSTSEMHPPPTNNIIVQFGTPRMRYTVSCTAVALNTYLS
jgi:hypothetical protein